MFGVNDGLVSNSSLVMGFAGSGPANTTIAFAALAGLLAGAFSMAAGEYISMRSQREAYEREIALEALELSDDPEAEAEELALIYRAKGLDPVEAERVSAAIMKDRDVALDTMAREELRRGSRRVGLAVVGGAVESVRVRARRHRRGVALPSPLRPGPR